MQIQRQPDGSIQLQMTQQQGRKFAKTVIENAEDAHMMRTWLCLILLIF